MSKAFEDATRKNVIAVRDHSIATRELMKAQGDQILFLRNALGTLQNQLVVIDAQVTALQVALYQGGQSDGD